MPGSIEIHYCPKCRWLLRSTWMAQELLTTFEDEIDELTLRSAEAGEFLVFANRKLIWSRRENGGFPEIKILKQLVRDTISPAKSLGHSDDK